ncbi:hypothetical protein ACFQ6N_00855 [Kitasatospora sp. NPDC056446]|uniref:hypothetical protein n=1 Tax=Kitasatospora sp. NPDC056446 TaxID=3345819 RepID=UPI00369CC874
MPDRPSPAQEPPADGESFVRLARHRVVYDIALVFYGVLTALALTDPLSRFARSIADAPQGTGLADWTGRLLTLTLLVQSAVWLHALAVAVESSDTRRGTDRYVPAMSLYWGGVLMVTVLMVMGATVARGTTAFLTASLGYLLWSLLFSLGGLRLHHGRLWTGPGRLLRELESQRRRWVSGRHAAALDFEQFRDPVGIYSVQESGVGLLVLGALAAGAGQARGPGGQFAFALAWLLIVLSSVAFHYRMEPWFYGL